jgi:NAD(P)-dependent dehydrogenase (short-subunit alcohol dehydrogenase family)
MTVASRKGVDFRPDRDIPDLTGKVIIVTGGMLLCFEDVEHQAHILTSPSATGGLGKEIAIALAKKHPKQIYLAARNVEKCQAFIDEVHQKLPDAPLSALECDLASLKSVQQAARKFASLSSRLDILIGSAGLMAVPLGLTQDGYEIQFGTNHLGHALLIKLLLPTMQRTFQEPNGDTRIVLMTSQGMGLHPAGGIRFDELRTKQDNLLLARWQLYGQSKLANLLYAAELPRRYPQITAASVHPGTINTGLVTGLGFWDRALVKVTNVGGMVTPEEGVRNPLWAATAPKDTIVDGEYYEPVGMPGKHARLSRSRELAARLWDWTEKELESYHL